MPASSPTYDPAARAQAIAQAGSIAAAIASGALPACIDTTLSEAVVLGLLLQGVRRYVCVLGHGSTDLGEILRIYSDAGVAHAINVRHETAASHAAAALRWVTGEKAAVLTSIGPGALQAMAGSLVASSDGLGLWYLFGDETTEDEGPNMQQIPKHEQSLYLKLCDTLGHGYCLHTPAALGTALRRGSYVVDHPYRQGPFFLLLPLNTQPARMVGLHLRELTVSLPPPAAAPCADAELLAATATALLDAERIVVKAGAGARAAGSEVQRFLALCGGVLVPGPRVTGLLPYEHPRNMLIGGSKGTLCGNFAMENADLLVALGTRAVCQSDSSRTAYPNVRAVIGVNADYRDALHYSGSIPLVGDVTATLALLNDHLEQQVRRRASDWEERTAPWLAACAHRKAEWLAFKDQRYAVRALYDPVWQREVLTQPTAIKVAADWARDRDAVTFFDAGDVQANGFQVAEDDRVGRTFTETGASYMGFAVSALLASALAARPFFGLAITGDGSFSMNPQILIDGVQHGVHGCILLLDNRRMAAISSLQRAQYGRDFATSDSVAVDYVALARAVTGVKALFGGHERGALRAALDEAHAYPGLSLIHVPVYFGDDPLGGFGAYGRWNVGNWVTETQQIRHRIGL